MQTLCVYFKSSVPETQWKQKSSCEDAPIVNDPYGFLDTRKLGDWLFVPDYSSSSML